MGLGLCLHIPVGGVVRSIPLRMLASGIAVKLIIAVTRVNRRVVDIFIVLPALEEEDIRNVKIHFMSRIEDFNIVHCIVQISVGYSIANVNIYKIVF